MSSTTHEYIYPSLIRLRRKAIFSASSFLLKSYCLLHNLVWVWFTRYFMLKGNALNLSPKIKCPKFSKGSFFGEPSLSWQKSNLQVWISFIGTVSEWMSEWEVWLTHYSHTVQYSLLRIACWCRHWLDSARRGRGTLTKDTVAAIIIRNIWWLDMDWNQGSDPCWNWQMCCNNYSCCAANIFKAYYTVWAVPFYFIFAAKTIGCQIRGIKSFWYTEDTA